MSNSNNELIRQEIELDPYRPGPAEARLRRSGVHVWAIIGYYLLGAAGDKQVVKRDYELTEQEVEAALAYYRRHRAEIDGRLAENNPMVVA
jgi:uncharacterized protein (DUF433 family)